MIANLKTFFQEVSNIHKMDEIIIASGSRWRGTGTAAQYTDIAVMTRHQILQNETFAVRAFVGAPIDVNGKLIRVVSGHLAYRSYG